LSFRKALKYLLVKELYRHEQDMIAIKKDLEKLKDVDLEDISLDVWIDV
jgi:hypothetical protein